MMWYDDSEAGGDNNNIDTGIKIDFTETWSMEEPQGVKPQIIRFTTRENDKLQK